MTPGVPPAGPVPRSLRALAVIQCLAATSLVALSAAVEDALSQWEWQVDLAVVAVVWWLLRRGTRAVADRSAAALDERDLADRNRVSWWGYAAAVCGGTATALVLVVLARVPAVDAQMVLDRAGPTLIALMLLAAVTPTTILAASRPASDREGDTVGF